MLNVGLNVALVPTYGIESAAWTALGCELVLLAGSGWLVWHHLGYLPSFLALAPRCCRRRWRWARRCGRCARSRCGCRCRSARVVYVAALALLGAVDRERLAQLR